jgi:hypothetical protein
MMQWVRQHKATSALVGVALVTLIAVASAGLYLASVAGELPWQTDPTRVADSITPFAGLDVFIPPTPSSSGQATATP